MEIKYLEWNLHAMGGIGYKIPNFIHKYINEVDIFVLVEFSMVNGWDDFRQNLEEFDLFCSPYISKGYNQVCVGIRKKIGNEKYNLISVEFKDVCNVNIPEFIHINIEIEKKKVNIIGTRIKTESGTQNQQFQYLEKYLSTIDCFCCLGDFNARYDFMNKNLSNVAEVYGPRTANDYHSFVHKNGDICELDWLLTKGFKDVYNGYSDAAQSPFATIDWSFIDSKNGYDNKTEYDYININGLPDHGILKGMLKL